MELCGRKMVIKRLTEHFAIDGEMCYRVRGEVAVSWRMVEYMYGVNVKCIAISFHLIVVKHSILMPINYRLGLKRRMSFATGIKIPAVVIGWRCRGSTLLAEPLKVHGLELSLSLVHHNAIVHFPHAKLLCTVCLSRIDRFVLRPVWKA
jgi:hypothetical protein